jgi:hypothetical protein
MVYSFKFDELPYFNSELPEIPSTPGKKLIPCNIWIAVANKDDPLPYQMKPFFDRNPSWKLNICDNNCKDEFMNKVNILTIIKIIIIVIR